MKPDRHVVCRVAELPPGSMRMVDIGPGIGVFNVDGRYFALRNDCPHQRAPLCEGEILGTSTAEWNGGQPRLVWGQEGRIIRCPWHRYEFDLTTGRSVARSRYRVKSYPVDVIPAAAMKGDGEVEDMPQAVCPDLTATVYPVHVEDDLVVLELRRRQT